MQLGAIGCRGLKSEISAADRNIAERDAASAVGDPDKVRCAWRADDRASVI
jgi:hypothetical protein